MSAVRPLSAEDETAWRPLWNAYLAFYDVTLTEATTADVWRRLLQGDPQFGFAALNEDGAMIGFAHCLSHATTWSARDYLYLEDLFVDPAARGAGAGRALIEAVYAEAGARGWARVYWHTHAGNDQARRLYDNLATLSDFVQYRR
ncbi:MAG: GNAT family N-acetyltransferase [Parvularculaceae bacterium]